MKMNSYGQFFAGNVPVRSMGSRRMRGFGDGVDPVSIVASAVGGVAGAVGAVANAFSMPTQLAIAQANGQVQVQLSANQLAIAQANDQTQLAIAAQSAKRTTRLIYVGGGIAALLAFGVILSAMSKH